MIWLSGRDIARSTIEMMQADGYVDAWRTIHADPDVEPGYTFPVWEPHVRLDYVFTPSAYATRMNACEVRTHPGRDALRRRTISRCSSRSPRRELAGGGAGEQWGVTRAC